MIVFKKKFMIKISYIIVLKIFNKLIYYGKTTVDDIACKNNTYWKYFGA